MQFIKKAISKARLVVMAMMAAVFALVAGPAFAVTDTTWVSSGVTAAQTALTDYINAAVPLLFPIVILIVSVYLIFKLVKKATH